MAIVTITGSDVSGGSPSGGGVGGASNLTTAGAVPYVASAGVLTEDATSFIWSTASKNLTVGTTDSATIITSFGRDNAGSFQSLIEMRTKQTLSTSGNNLGKGTIRFYDTVQGTSMELGFYEYGGGIFMDDIFEFWTQRVSVRSLTGAGYLEVRDSTDAKAINFEHSGTTGIIATTNGNIRIFPESGLTGVNNATPKVPLHVTALADSTSANSLAGTVATFQNITNGSSAYLEVFGAFDGNSGLIFSDGSEGHKGRIIYSHASEFMSFWTDGAERARLASTGNLLLGTTTDNNYKLDIAASGSSGTLRVYDSTATVGVTSVVVQNGAGQGVNTLTAWKTSAAQDMLRVTSAGNIESIGNQIFMTNSGYTLSNVIVAPELDLASGRLLRWSSTTDAAASKDLSFSRTTASIARLGDGGANANGYLQLRGIQSSGLTVSGLPTASAYAGMMIYVTDATATTIGTTVAGGGANKVMVWSDGTNWKIYAS